ncbi:hypothetical protein SAY87_027908 [Trapa incisa]|uniref:Leucine-rich repeat-containing N-terminal plant-type domain-containing protein n=1 Tax=Trapa incisa TaxID=236973 RepID=A0AAN7KWW7_9MYRT|nr:hypothetical protein SAY87_027908 [Trapa incisa]
MSTRATSSTHHLLLLLLSLSLLAQHSLSKEANCNKDDRRALLKIKKELNIHWITSYDCCDWGGVFCDSPTHPHRVTAFVHQYVNSPSRIPDAIGDLPYLTEIFFHKLTNFSGTIPYSITKLKYLKYLDISWVNLTGNIPDFLGQLTSLTYLRLSFNKLTGPIPSSLSQIPNLSFIDLSRNKLTGTIPASLANLKGNHSFQLFLSHNQLSGHVPDSFAKINFFEIDLSRNMLQGGLSILFGHNKTTETMYFSRNMFEFDMSELQLPKSLVQFDISHNKIYGRIPEAMTDLELQAFNVSYNRLCGKIPQGGNLQTGFDYSSFFHNRCLCGAPLNVTCK